MSGQEDHSSQAVMKEVMTPSKMLVAELREELTARGLSPKGLKKDLVERLEAALEGQTDKNGKELPVTQKEEEPIIESKNDQLRTQEEPSQHADQKELLPEEFQKPFEDLKEEKTKKNNEIEELHQDKTPEENKFDDSFQFEEEHQPKKTKITEHEQAKNLEKDLKASIEGPKKPDEPIVESKDEPTAKETSKEELNENTTVAFKELHESKEETMQSTLNSPFVHIRNLARPFAVPAFKEKLSSYGQVLDFWIDALKSNCYVQFATASGAESCKAALDGCQWPIDNVRRLRVDYIPDMPAMARTKTDNNPTPKTPAKSLDDLFYRTKTEPQLFYLPAVIDEINCKK